MNLRTCGAMVLGVAMLVEATAAFAAGTVQLELIGEASGGNTALHAWGEALDKAGIRTVRIRSGTGSEKPGIVNNGPADKPSYAVTGLIVSRDEIALPGGRFRISQLGQLKTFLDDLAANGPPNQREPRGAFGMTAKQFAVVYEPLGAKVDFSTAGVGRGAAVAKIAQRLPFPLKLDPAVARKLDEDKVAEELSGMAIGTALAYILRPAGYCLSLRAAGASFQYDVVAAKPGLEVWPVGYAPKEPNKVLPLIQEFLNVNVQNVSAADALEAIAGRLKAPVLVDHNAVARHGLDPSKTIVNLPQGRTTYSLALRKLLAQAGMKFELRVDEAETPFLWVTSMKPM